MQSSSTVNTTTGRSGRKILTVLILLTLLIGSIIVWWHYYYTYSDGYRYGLLQKFSHKGNLIKTYEGEMILSSVKGNNNVAIASEKFYFSVIDKSVAQQLDNLQGHTVTLHYRQKKYAAFWRGDSEYIVDSVKQE
jgi:hypothetical protein